MEGAIVESLGGIREVLSARGSELTCTSPVHLSGAPIESPVLVRLHVCIPPACPSPQVSACLEWRQEGEEGCATTLGQVDRQPYSPFGKRPK